MENIEVSISRKRLISMRRNKLFQSLVKYLRDELRVRVARIEKECLGEGECM